MLSFCQDGIYVAIVYSNVKMDTVIVVISKNDYTNILKIVLHICTSERINFEAYRVFS